MTSVCEYEWMGFSRLASCEFQTERLNVVPWHDSAHAANGDLAKIIAKMLNPRTTAALPAAWRGDFSEARAASWIDERDNESPTLLVTESETGLPVGLLILAELAIEDLPIEESVVDVRIGYLLDTEFWGRGLATELVAGLVQWAGAKPAIFTITGGVATDNPTSAQVLVKNGFSRIADGEKVEATYQLELEQEGANENEWDNYADGWDDNDTTRTYAVAAFASLEAIAGAHGIALIDAQVLDFGCGTGLLTERLVDAGASVFAVDSSAAMLAILDGKVTEHGWVNVVTNAHLPTATSVYDLIVCSSVCSFLEDYPSTVEDLVSLVQPGGLFVQWDWERQGDDPHGLSREEVQEALEGASLEGVSVTTGFVVTVDGQTMHSLVGYGRRLPVDEN